MFLSRTPVVVVEVRLGRTIREEVVDPEAPAVPVVRVVPAVLAALDRAIRSSRLGCRTAGTQISRAIHICVVRAPLGVRMIRIRRFGQLQNSR